MSRGAGPSRRGGVVPLAGDARRRGAGVLMLGVGRGPAPSLGGRVRRPMAAPARPGRASTSDATGRSHARARRVGGPRPARRPRPVGFAALLARFGTGARDHGGRRRAGRRGAPDGDAAPSTRTGATGAPIHAERGPGDRRGGRATPTSSCRRVRALGVRVVTVEEPAYPLRLAVGRHAAARPVRHRRPGGAVPGARGRDRRDAPRDDRPAARPRAGSRRPWSPPTRRSCPGLAFGIDGAAHEATVRAGGTTVAVIGGGHAVVAPAVARPAGRGDHRERRRGRVRARRRTSSRVTARSRGATGSSAA